MFFSLSLSGSVKPLTATEERERERESLCLFLVNRSKHCTHTRTHEVRSEDISSLRKCMFVQSTYFFSLSSNQITEFFAAQEVSSSFFILAEKRLNLILFLSRVLFLSRSPRYRYASYLIHLRHFFCQQNVIFLSFWPSRFFFLTNGESFICYRNTTTLFFASKRTLDFGVEFPTWAQSPCA